MANIAFVVTTLLLANVPAEALRDEESNFAMEAARAQRNAENEFAMEKDFFTCNNYCVKCNDHSTVFYGRDRNWAKAVASASLTGVGTIGLFTGYGAVVAGAAIAGAGLAGFGAAIKQNEENSSSVAGYTPTTGWSCERVDVVKYQKGSDCSLITFMEASNLTFGRIKNNQLKPYVTMEKKIFKKNKIQLLDDFKEKDIQIYEDFCKVLKGSGFKGAAKQFWSNFQGKKDKHDQCPTVVDHSAKACSRHSKLCGQQGVAGLIQVKTSAECLKSCEESTTETICAGES